MKAIVLLSGGQDSTTALAWACVQWKPEDILALSIFYGQRHSTELAAARIIAGIASVKHEELYIDAFGKAMAPASALVGGGDVSSQSKFNTQLPASFVPARNALFLTLAAGVMAREKADNIVTGVCQTDYSGYPDCRREFINSMEKTLELALDMKRVSIHTPLMYMSKAETVKLMARLNCMWWLKLSHTCYEGQQPPCQTCPACILRAKGFAEAGMKDPLLEGQPIVPPAPATLPPDDMPF
jgi:7-cyano-7-deazaguanine synthase